MKTRTLAFAFLSAAFLSVAAWMAFATQPDTRVVPAPTGSTCDSAGYLQAATEAEQLRASRRLTAEAFAKMAKEPNTIVLDARSKTSHDLLRVKGSINLPFTDMASSTLAQLVPDKSTRILIYCRNNLLAPNSSSAAGVDLMKAPSVRTPRATVEVIREFVYPTEFDPPKIPQAGLNIPTFITLYIYGYRNIWELDPAVDPGGSPVEFESGAPASS